MKKRAKLRRNTVDEDKGEEEENQEEEGEDWKYPTHTKENNNLAKFLKKIIGWSCSRSVDGENRSHQNTPAGNTQASILKVVIPLLRHQWLRCGGEEGIQRGSQALCKHTLSQSLGVFRGG